MAYTFATLKAEIKTLVWPDGVPESLDASVNSFFQQAMIDLQRWVECLQVRNVSLFPFCATYFRCGCSVIDAPRGRINRIATVRGENYCDPVQYYQVSYDRLMGWSRRFTALVSPPVNTGLAKLPLGFKYPESSTNNKFGRALEGLWAIEKGRLFIAPWIQSDELVAVEWDGLQRKWAEGDLVPDEEDFKQAVKLYVQAQFAKEFDGDADKYLLMKSDYEEARATLMWQCREETRLRETNVQPEGISVLWENYLTTPQADLVPASSGDVSGSAAVVWANIGDYGQDNTPESKVATLVKSFNPSFVVTTGDNDYVADLASAVGKYYGDFVNSSDITKNRFWPCLGNHDLDRVSGGVGGQPYLDYFKLPGNERYYDVVIGDLHLFVLNSGLNTAGTLVEPDGNTSLSLQGEWFRNAVARSMSRWKVVVFHHPAKTSSSTYYPGYSDLQWDFKSYGIDLVLNGHGHQYERLNVGGVPVIINGAGGADLVGFHSPPVAESLVRYNADNGALKVTMKCSELKAEFINTSNVVVDTLTLKK